MTAYNAPVLNKVLGVVRVEGANVGKTSWEMTQEAFDLLMTRLDANREVAGLKYEDMRLMLIKLFENRNIPASADHADEVINRLTRKLVGGEEIKSLTAYALGVARLYLKEVPRRMREVAVEGDDWPEHQEVNPVVEEDEPQQEECFMRCLNSLRGDDREMILQYYQEEKQAKINHRRNLAQKLGLTTITLRTRACRVRIKLEECINRCITDSTT